MQKTTLTATDARNELLAQYIFSDPYTNQDVPGLPRFLKAEGFGNQVNNYNNGTRAFAGRIRNFGANMVLLGNSKSRHRDVQLVRLDWRTSLTPESLAATLRDEKGPESDWDTSELPGKVLFSKDGLMIAGESGVGTPEDGRPTNRISILGSPEVLATNPTIRLLGEMTLSYSPASEYFLQEKFKEIESIAARQSRAALF